MKKYINVHHKLNKNSPCTHSHSKRSEKWVAAAQEASLLPTSLTMLTISLLQLMS